MEKNDRIKLNAIRKRWLGRKRFGQYQKGLAEFPVYDDVNTLIKMVERLDAKMVNTNDIYTDADVERIQYERQHA